MPFVVVMLVVSHLRYGMAVPAHLGQVLFFIVLGVTAFRAIGLIVAAVVNSMQESGIIVQILYMTMLFLSGATFPTQLFPGWLLTVSQFIPATYLVMGLQGIILRNETLWTNWQAVAALLLTTVVGLLLSMKLFRWEKEEKMRPAAKLWLAAVLMPFVLLGSWQVHTKDNVQKSRITERLFARSRSRLFRNARIFIGDGRTIENGAVLVKDGLIAEVYEGTAPDAKSLNAEDVEAAGKTILPGLVDTHVHLGAPGGVLSDYKDYNQRKAMQRALLAYLYSGVTAVRSVGDGLDDALAVRALVNSGERQGAEFFTTGPLFTTEGGHGTEYFRNLPPQIRTQAEAQFTRLPKTPAEAKQMVDALKAAGVDAVKIVMESGAAGRLYNRLDTSLLQAINEAAHADGLKVTVHTGGVGDVEDSLRAKVDGIEHGSFSERIPDADFAQMARQGVSYDPTLSVAEAFQDVVQGRADLLNRSLVQQVSSVELIKGTRAALTSPEMAARRKEAGEYPIDLNIARDNLQRAWRAGVFLVTGSDAGNMLVIHGPTIQHEIALWLEAGIPADVSLRAATANGAKVLGAEKRFGTIEKGREATLLIVDGNPLADVKALEAISIVIFKGERVNRVDLFKPE